MVQETVKKKKKWIILLAVLVLIPLCAYLLLFQINRFDFVIQLKGEGEMTLAVGEHYEETGVETKLVGSLFFRNGLDVDAQIRTSQDLDTSVPGEYTITYDASYRELSAFASRRVLVMDTDPPRITLTSIPGAYTIYGEAYSEEGFSAWDDCDGDITDRVTRQESDGYVFYSVTDSAGNMACVSRKIRYYDPYPPEITLNGETTVYINAGAGYTELGWTAIDNCDGDVSGWVKVSGSVDRYLGGSYELTYTVRDSTGNTASAVRTVVVVPKPPNQTVTPSGKVIYLTFDDGPGPYTRELLEVLEQYDVKATFFVVGGEYSHIIGEIVDGGHAVGIHSVSHDYQEIYAGADAFFNDLLTMQQIICRESGVMTYLMRFPGGSSNTVSRFNPGIMTYLTQAVEDMGFRYFDWNVDSMDAGGARDAEDVFDHVTSGAQNRRISIVLQHDIKGFSVDAVEEIIIWALENGYTFLPLDMTSPTAHHGVNN